MPTLVDGEPTKYFNHPQFKLKPGPGRPKGSKNTLGESVRWGLMEAYARLGGVSGLVKWGREKPDLFYPMLKALLPHELAESGLAGNITVIVQRNPETPSEKPVVIEANASAQVTQAEPQAEGE